MAEIESTPVQKHPKRKKILIITSVVLLVLAAGGAGIALRWWQQQSDDSNGEFAGPTLSTDASELQDLRSEGNEEEFNEKVADVLADPNLDTETRYQVLLQQGHNFFDQQDLQGAIEAYLEAEQVQETHEIAELLANTYARSGNAVKAIEYFEKASNLISNDNPRRAAIQKLYADYIQRLENGEQLEGIEQ